MINDYTREDEFFGYLDEGRVQEEKQYNIFII